MNRRERLKRFLIKNRDRVVSAAKLAGMKTKQGWEKFRRAVIKVLRRRRRNSNFQNA
nr:MAG TPA: hypothetical protein [Bacteriophage sp.]DAX54237.1 MAG TPA: hypothetical protein [Bacteriophage sp.]